MFVYVIHQAFMAHVVWLENMELTKNKKTKLYFIQRPPKYAVWCRCYLYGQKWDEILITCNVDQWDFFYNNIKDYLHKMHINQLSLYISQYLLKLL